jgi:hypothetical protein
MPRRDARELGHKTLEEIRIRAVEQVWNYVKHHGVGRAALRSAADLRTFVLVRLRSLQRLPWTVRMFFLTPDTQYAAL